MNRHQLNKKSQEGHGPIVYAGTKPRYHKRKKPAAWDAWLLKRMYQLRARATLAEIEFKNKLDALGIEYVFQAGFVCTTGMSSIFDFYLPLHRKIIEIDGGYHTSEEQVLADATRDWVTRNRLHLCVRRLTNEQALKMTADEVKAFIGGKCVSREDPRLTKMIRR